MTYGQARERRKAAPPQSHRDPGSASQGATAIVRRSFEYGMASTEGACIQVVRSYWMLTMLVFARLPPHRIAESCQGNGRVRGHAQENSV